MYSDLVIPCHHIENYVASMDQNKIHGGQLIIPMDEFHGKGINGIVEEYG